MISLTNYIPTICYSETPVEVLLLFRDVLSSGYRVVTVVTVVGRIAVQLTTLLQVQGVR